MAPPLHPRPPLLNLGRKSIRVQLSLLVLALVLPLLVVALWHLGAERMRDRDDARAKVKLMVDNASDRLLATLRAHELLLSQIAAQPLVQAMQSASCDTLIRDYARLNPQYFALGTVDMQGTVVCTARPDVPSQQQVLAYPWFQQGLRSPGVLASDALFDPTTQRWVVVVTMPVKDAAGRLAGLVVLPLDLIALGKEIFGVVPPDANISVTDRQTRILMRYRDPEAWIGKPAPPDVDGGVEEGFVERAGVDGIQRVLAFKRLPSTGWQVSAGVPEQVVYARANADLRSGLLILAAILLAALTIAWRLSLNIVRPLDALVTTAGRVGRGDLAARVQPISGAHEMEAMAASVNQMLDAQTIAQQSLRASEENLAITLNSIGDAVIATDAQGLVTRMNIVAERLTGWPLAQARGLPLATVFRIVNAETRAAAPDPLQVFRSVDPVTREVSPNPVQRVLEVGQVVGSANHTTLLARDGMEHQISDSAAPIRDAAGAIQGVVLVFSDVTEAHRLQRVLEESESRYRALVESSPVGVAVYHQAKLIYVNPTAVEIMGARVAEDLIGRNLVDFIHPDYHPLLALRVQQAETAQQGAVMPMTDWQYVRLDGAVIDVQAQGTVIRLQGDNAVQVSFLDITSRKRSERTLRDSEARFRALTHLSSDWYWEQDAQLRFVRMDGDLLGMTGLTPEEHIGKTRWELAKLSLSEAEWERHRALLQTHQEFRDFQMRRTNHKGKELWISVSGTPIFDTRGVFKGYRGVGRDITAQKLAADQIHALAFYDALTELPNRRLLMEQLKKALLTHLRSHRQAALLFIDLDNFKTLNDTLGHETGDMLLRQVARRLLACVREADSVARLGGDEFVVMLEDLSADLPEAVTQAEQVGYKILAAFGPPFVLAGRECRSTPSIGITLFGSSNEDVEDLLKQADLAMYQAKAAGRNTLRMFDAGMQAAVELRAALEADLRAALLGGQMLLHYQPVVQADGRVTGAEALVRWQHPVRGLVGPGEFIGLAEATGLILPLGQWVLATACTQIAAWGHQSRTAHLTLAVNVSAHQFVEPDFVPRVLQALDLAGADPRRLKLELTESLLAHNMDDVARKMGVLRDRGIDFSLDDFGTGYSSLSYLKRLPLAQLKIDQSFVRDVLVDPNDAAIARTVVALGASLGLAVIAEGVETEGQYQFLLGLGCNAFQGYLFGRPMPIEEFEEFVRG